MTAILTSAHQRINTEVTKTASAGTSGYFRKAVDIQVLIGPIERVFNKAGVESARWLRISRKKTKRTNT